MTTLADRILQLAKKLGGEELLTSQAIERLSLWLSEMQRWNKTHDLTAAKTEIDLVELMVADALMLACHMPQAASVVDVGTGPGAPGLALAILRPDISMLLVEPRQKRVGFMRSCLGQPVLRTELDRIKIHGGRSDELEEATFDEGISRATFAPDEWLIEGRRLARKGVWLLLTGDAPQPDVGESWEYTLPSSGAGRRLVRCNAQKEG